MVYVIAKNDKPLMPCSNVIARLLLKNHKAKVKRREPFTIKLLYETTEYTQNLTLGVDTGSGTLGTAVTTEDSKIVYASEVTVRNDIHKKMTRRSRYRRDRRTRKTRYRKARWQNRRNSMRKDRFSPTMISKLHSHVKEIEYIKSILPITRIVLETGQFDTHLMKNPALANPKIRHWGYQKGLNYGFANTKAMVLNRDNYTCQYCHGKRNDPKLEKAGTRFVAGVSSLLRGKVFCGECGAPYIRRKKTDYIDGKPVRTFYNWRCDNRVGGENGKGCKNRIIKEADLKKEIGSIPLDKIEKIQVFPDRVEVQIKKV